MKPPSQEEFVVLMARNQRVIWRFINTLLPVASDADDVLQETSLVLWRKWDQYDRDRDFVNWAFGIAKLQVLRYVRENRSKRVHLDETVLSEIATIAERHALGSTPDETRLQALKDCVGRLRDPERGVVEARYTRNQTARQISASCEKPLASIYTLLRRARLQLAECVSRKLAAAEGVSG